MPGSILDRIRQQVLAGEYDVSDHALDEAADDDLDIFDIETALLSGRIRSTFTNDPRGTRYEVIGAACDQERSVAVVGRFRGDEVFRIITVYEPNG